MPRARHRRPPSGDAALLGAGAEVLAGGDRRALGAGELAVIDAGTVHTLGNHGPGDARILVIMTPEVDELIAVLHSGDSAGDRAAIWERYHSSLA